MHLNYRLLNIAALAAMALTFQSCRPLAPGVYKNNGIPSSQRDDLHKLNTEVLADLKDDKLLALQNQMSKEMLDDPGIPRTVEKISIYMKRNKFKLLNDYLFVDTSETKLKVKEGASTSAGYQIAFNSVAAQTYMAFFVQARAAESFMLTIIYSKYDYGWKVTRLEAAPYAINGSTSPELFKQAALSASKNYLVDALNTMQLAQQCSTPSDEWEYNSARQMDKIYGALLNAANQQYHFPFIVKQVPGNLQIIRVFNQKTEAGQYPVIYYLSNIKLADTAAVKQENLRLRKVIGQVMQGIDKDKKYLYYSVFNTRPNAKGSVDHVDLRQNLQ